MYADLRRMKKFTLKFVLFFISFGKLNGLRNGEKVLHYDARFIASIRLQSLEQQAIGSGFLCTASVINNRHAVTAATCVTNYLVSQLQIVMGVVDISTRNSRAVNRNIRRMHFHPLFNRTSETNEFYGNVAVVEFSSSIRHSSSRWAILENSNFRNFHVQPARLSDFKWDLASMCLFFSWGQESNHSERISNLLMTFLGIVNDTNCRTSDSIFCAHIGNRDEPVLCRNLGGPLICNSTIYGLATSDSCDDIGHFLSISFYRDWILAVSGSLKLKIWYQIFITMYVIIIFIK